MTFEPSQIDIFGPGSRTLAPGETYEPLRVVSLSGQSGFSPQSRVVGFATSSTRTQTRTQTVFKTPTTEIGVRYSVAESTAAHSPGLQERTVFTSPVVRSGVRISQILILSF